MVLNVNSTYSFYGDSISAYRLFGTFSVSLNRELDGRMRLAENDDLVASENLAVGWNLAIAGTTVTQITQRFKALVTRDEADVVVVLMGTNNYGRNGATPQDWIDRAQEIIDAAAAAGKLLVFLPPIDHQNDPVAGREALKAWLPTVRSSTVIVPDTSTFDAAIHTDDGVHPNQAGGQLLASVVAAALRPVLAAQYPDIAPAEGLVANGDLAGTGGVLRNLGSGATVGQVADGWALTRVSGAGVARAQKYVLPDGNEGQRITYDGKGVVRLEQRIAVDAKAGDQYEIVVHVRVDDPNRKFFGFWAQDGDSSDGVELFAGTVLNGTYTTGTGSFDAVLRSPKLTVAAAEDSALVQLLMVFDGARGAVVNIDDVHVVRVGDRTPPPVLDFEAQALADL